MCMNKGNTPRETSKQMANEHVARHRNTWDAARLDAMPPDQISRLIHCPVPYRLIEKSLRRNPSLVVCPLRRLVRQNHTRRRWSTLSRAGHAAAWDEERGGMWIHGGYTTFYPYISSDGAGSGVGTTASSRWDAMNTPLPHFVQNPIYNSKSSPGKGFRTTWRLSKLTRSFVSLTPSCRV